MQTSGDSRQPMDLHTSPLKRVAQLSELVAATAAVVGGKEPGGE
jgi:hypothetical protein